MRRSAKDYPQCGLILPETEMHLHPSNRDDPPESGIAPFACHQQYKKPASTLPPVETISLLRYRFYRTNTTLQNSRIPHAISRMIQATLRSNPVTVKHVEALCRSLSLPLGCHYAFYYHTKTNGASADSVGNFDSETNWNLSNTNRRTRGITQKPEY
jgi:hypothetical protein